jgi:hypothetical protein
MLLMFLMPIIGLFFHLSLPALRPYVGLCNGTGLHPHSKILSIELEVGLFYALHRIVVFGHDLDVGHPLLEGKRGGMEGAGPYGEKK